jgi:MFS family permease
MLLVSSAEPAEASPEALVAPRIYYGWVLVCVLGVLATVSYGTLSYAFSVFINPMQQELGWTKAELTGAFSVATLVAGLTAVPVGRWVDRHGARGLMMSGGAVASLLLYAWSRVETLLGFYAIWAAMGIAMAAVLYEPAFAVVAVWFDARRGRALTLLTFLGGFASVIFVPLTALWVETYGWRGALVRLAVVQAALTIPLPSLLRRRPQDLGLLPDGHPSSVEDAGPAVSVGARAAVGSASFRWLTIAFACSYFTTTAMAVHLVPLLLERGYPARMAAGAMGLLGLMALPGRLVFTPLGDRWPRGAVTACIFLLQGIGLALLLSVRAPWSVWAFVALFGAGLGAITPARAALVADLFGTAAYGRISGALTLVTSVAKASAPVGASLLYGLGSGYTSVSATLLLLCLGSAISVTLAERAAYVHLPSPA